jgi:hypothetical protein
LDAPLLPGNAGLNQNENSKIENGDSKNNDPAINDPAINDPAIDATKQSDE